MGQSRISNDNLLTNRIIALEQEVKSLKVRQNYILDQDKWEKSNSITLYPTEKTIEIYGQQITVIWLCATLEFEGAFKDKPALGYCIGKHHYPVPIDGSVLYAAIGDPDNQNKLGVKILSTAQGLTRNTGITFTMVANMPGTFKLITQE